jgi:hypothetical protein
MTVTITCLLTLLLVVGDGTVTGISCVVLVFVRRASSFLSALCCVEVSHVSVSVSLCVNVLFVCEQA